MTQLLTWLTTRIALRDERGQTAVEYAMVIAGVSIVIVGLLVSGIGTSLFTNFFTKLGNALK